MDNSDINSYRVCEKYTNEAFQFLIDDFGYKRAKTVVHAPDMYITFRTSKTNVSIESWGTLPSLIISNSPRKVKGVSEKSWYMALHKLAKIRCPEKWEEVEQHLKSIDPKVLESESVELNREIRNLLYSYADILKNYCADILRGDFSAPDLWPEKKTRKKKQVPLAEE